MGIKDPLLTLPCSSEAPMVPSHGYPSFPSLVMIFPAAELRQINLQCLDATQIPSGSRKSINRTAEGKRTSSKFWMWEPSAEAESGRTCPRFCGTGNVGEFPVGKGQIVPFFNCIFCQAPCQMCRIPAWKTPGFVSATPQHQNITRTGRITLLSPTVRWNPFFI